MYKAVRTYRLRPGATEEFLRRVRESFVSLISQLAGFIAYDVQHIGNDQVRTISTFATRASAEESILLALRWVQEQCMELMRGVPKLNVVQLPTAYTSISVPHAPYHQREKRWYLISPMKSSTQVCWVIVPLQILM